MWRNYLTVGFRALAKSKTYAFINIFGLAIGMAACLMILLYVRYEFSYDALAARTPSASTRSRAGTSRRARPARNAQLQMTRLSSRARRCAKDFPQIEREVYVCASDAGRHPQRPGQLDRGLSLIVDGNFFDVVPAAAACAATRDRARPGRIASC